MLTHVNYNDSTEGKQETMICLIIAKCIWKKFAKMPCSPPFLHLPTPAHTFKVFTQFCWAQGILSEKHHREHIFKGNICQVSTVCSKCDQYLCSKTKGQWKIIQRTTITPHQQMLHITVSLYIITPAFIRCAHQWEKLLTFCFMNYISAHMQLVS